MEKTSIDYVVISYNRSDLLANLVDSIKEYASLGYSLTIVDNNSTEPGIKEYLWSLKKQGANVIFNQQNFGYAKACNIGISLGKAKYVMVLNNDTEITEELDVSSIRWIEFLENAGILGYLLSDKKGICKGCGVSFQDVLRGWGKPVSEARAEFNVPAIVKYVGGSAMFLKREVWEKVGHFNQEYIFYCEDLHFCKAAGKIGYQTYYVPHIVIHEHEGSLGTSKEASRAVRNSHFSKSLQILKKYYPEEGGICKKSK